MAESKNIHQATDQNFESEVTQKPGLAIVDFWAEWCGPCRMLGPTIESLADQYEGKLSVYKMNVDDNPMTPGKFHVRGIPTVIFLKNGQLVDQVVGNQPKSVFEDTIRRHL